MHWWLEYYALVGAVIGVIFGVWLLIELIGSIRHWLGQRGRK